MENPEGFLHPPSPGIPTTLLSSLHCHHSTKLHTNTLTIIQQIHKCATEKYGKMQKYKHLPKPKPYGPLRLPLVLGFCAQMPNKNNKMHNYEMITQKRQKIYTYLSNAYFNCCTTHEQTTTLNYKMPLKINKRIRVCLN